MALSPGEQIAPAEFQATNGAGVFPQTTPQLASTWLIALGAAKLLIHLALGGRYGYFRDELYYLDAGRYLAWGYVDFAPLIALYAKIGLLLGGSLHAIRLIPALAGAGVVALTIYIARELGGGRFAQGWPGLPRSSRPPNRLARL